MPGVGRLRLLVWNDWLMDMGALIQTICISALPVIFAITLHEAAHGYAARHFGDPTAWQAGRISLNPLRHIDPVGTLLVPGLTLNSSGSRFLIGAGAGAALSSETFAGAGFAFLMGF